jgi:hypothetical protein
MPVTGSPGPAHRDPRNPLDSVRPVELNNIIALCARRAVRKGANVTAIHDDIYRLLTLETADGQSAWYEAREAPTDRYGSLGDTEGADDFSADLNAAWSVAAQLPEPVAPLCCYALMRASARGLAGRLSIPMLAAVVEEGVWSADTGLAYLQRLPDEEQATAAMALALWIPTEASRRLVEQHQPLSSSEQAVLDGCLAHAPDLFRPLLRQMSGMSDSPYRRDLVGEAVVAMAALAPSLSSALLGQAAGFLDHCGRSGRWDPARAAIAARLAATGSAEAALDLAAGLVGHLAWVDTMAEVLARLDARERASAVAAELMAAEEAASDLQRVRHLSALLPHLHDPERTTSADMALRAAFAVDADDLRADALIGLLPRLKGTGKDQAVARLLAAVCSPDGDRQRWSWPAVRVLAPVLTPGQVRELLAPRARARSFGPMSLPEVLASLPDEAARRLAAGSLAPRDVAAVLPADMLASLVADALKDAADGRAVADTDKERAQATFIAEIAAVLPEPVVRSALSAAAPEEGLARTRTDLLAELLPQLARSGHVEEVLSVIRQRLHGRDAARALTLTASYLTEAQLDEAIEIVTHAIGDYEAHYRNDALTGLAPFLNSRQLRRSLSLTVALGDREDMIGALSASAEMLAVFGIIDGAQAALDGIPDPYSRAVAAAGSAEVLEPAERMPLLAAGLAACLDIKDGQDRARALAALLPLYGPQERRPAMAALTAALAESKDLHLRIRDLLAAADGLPESERTALLDQAVAEVLADPDAGALPSLSLTDARWSRRFGKRLASQATGRLAAALLASWALGDGRRGVESLAGYLARLTEEDRFPLLDQALALAYTARDNSLRARTLVTLTPVYPASDRRIMTLAALDEALRQRGQERTDLLADLAARLPEGERPLVTARMVQAMAWPHDETPRPLSDDGPAWTSGSVGTLMAPRRSAPAALRLRLLLLLGRACPLRFPAFIRAAPPLAQGEATSFYVFMLPNYDRDAAARAHAAVEVARRITESEREPVLARALAAAREARYPSQRSKALREVAELSPAPARAALAEEALAAARAIEPGAVLSAERAPCLAGLVSLLDAELREAVTVEALAALLAEDRDPGMPRALADQLTEPVVRQALSDLHESGDQSWRTASLLPCLTTLGHPDEALTRIAALPDARQRGDALADCAGHLDQHQVRQSLQMAVPDQGSPEYATDRAVALLLIRLVDLGYADEAVAWARNGLRGNLYMPTVVLQLIKHVPEADQPELALAALKSALRQFPSRDERAIARSLAAYAMEAPRSVLLEYMQAMLGELSPGPRSSLLRSITDLGALIVGIDGAQALDEVARAVVKVCRWWPTGTDERQPISWRSATAR